MSAYAFVTRWRIRAPIDAVWAAVFHAERWPEWWPGLQRVEELAAGDGRYLGCGRRFVWKGALPYTLTVEMTTTRVEPPTLLESAATGELVGRGVWRLAPVEGGTSVRYDWNVSPAKRWMRRLDLVARPVFRWNHDVVMRRGERGLKRLLETAASMNRRDDALEKRLWPDAGGEDTQHQGGQHDLGQAAHRDR
ncbi:MAG: SRPBCC family protein [Candidatus Omnitrophica bacterium]|nr:SRPBCC family protein [Candidatus Omnitrophota bacterium]